MSAPSVAPSAKAPAGPAGADQIVAGHHGPRSDLAAAVIAAAAMVVGATLRWWPRSALWLDEAQSVSFASLPLTRIPAALREDGAPPLYYLLLHGWMRSFGDSDTAVRSLSVVLSLAATVVLGLVVARWMGRRAGLATIVLVACNPFAVRYGSEARMYALVMLEVALGFGLVTRIFEKPRMRRAIALAVVAAALLYTHYWSLYLLGSVTIASTIALWRHRREPRWRRPLLTVLGSLAAAGVLWLPWIPSFRYQSQHTATPWAPPATVAAALDAAGFRFAGVGALIPAFAVAITLLVVAGVVRRRSAAAFHVGAPTVSPGALLATVVGCAVLAVIGGSISHSAYTARYTSVMFPLVMAVAAAGVAVIAPRRWAAGAVAVAVVLGTSLAIREIGTDRTRAGAITSIISAESHPDDVVVYCPDQLGPASSRLLRRHGVLIGEETYPAGSLPGRVNWIDYVARYRTAEPRPFVHGLGGPGPSTIWLVWSGTYPPTQHACRALFDALLQQRPDGRLRIADDPGTADHGALWEFPPLSP